MIGKLIRQDREKRNINQVELASRAKLSQAYISQVENGERTPTPDVLERISNALDVESAVYVQFMMDSKELLEKAMRGLTPGEVERVIRFINRIKKPRS